MTSMTQRTSLLCHAASRRWLWCVVGGAMLLAGQSTISERAAAQEKDSKTLLVTSFGLPEIPAPNIMPEIFRMNVDGSGRKALLAKTTMAFDPSLAPDGKLTAFVASTHDDLRDENATWALYVMNAGGSERRQLAKSKNSSEYLLAPAWSPDGKQIAYCTFVFGFRGNGTAFSSPPQIHLIDADGKNHKPIKKAEGLNPTWSPDGKRLLFTQVGKDDAISLSAVNVDGSQLQQLVKRASHVSTTGAWSSDGKWLAYTILVDDDPESDNKRVDGLYLAKADGTDPKRLTGGPNEIAFGVQWAADSRQLYFTRRDRSGPPLKKDEKTPANAREWSPFSVYAIGIDGENLRRVSVGKERDYIGGNFLFAIQLLVQ